MFPLNCTSPFCESINLSIYSFVHICMKLLCRKLEVNVALFKVLSISRLLRKFMVQEVFFIFPLHTIYSLSASFGPMYYSSRFTGINLFNPLYSLIRCTPQLSSLCCWENWGTEVEYFAQCYTACAEELGFEPLQSPWTVPPIPLRITNSLVFWLFLWYVAEMVMATRDEGVTPN